MNIPATADVTIVGGGVHGASIAYHLAHKGAGRVVLVEATFLAFGPTGRSTGLVRRFYGLDFLSRMANESADVFQNWSELIGGDPGFHQVGCMVLADGPRAENLRNNVDRANRLGIRVQLLLPDDIRALVPEMMIEDVPLASFEPGSGYADPSSTTTCFANRARDLGAVIIQSTPVSAILVQGGSVSGVRTTKGDISSPHVVVCAGPWSSRLLSPLGITVEILNKRHQISIFRRPPAFTAHPAISDLPRNTYMRPEHGHLTLFGLGKYDEVVDPDNYQESIDPSEIDANVKLITRRFPVMANGEFHGGYSGVYDVTPDGKPVLGPIPEVPGLYACFGWSGHGFKHAPVVGDVMSDVLLKGHSALYDLEPFRWSRFLEGRALPADHSVLAPPQNNVVR